VQSEQGAFHEPDEEARIFTEQGMSILYFPFQLHILVLYYEC
jgi:hypothetical protein